MLRRLYADQPENFAFTPANEAWAEAQISKYPEGRQASAVIPLLWRAQEQEGWLSRPAMEHVAGMLGMAYIRVLEVATFYFMFQLHPTGSVAHVQVCGTTSCMICGAEDLIKVCREKISGEAHTLSSDGKFTWEEVECLGACANAPMAQIGKDYYEDLTPQRFGEILDELSSGSVPVPGPQNGRYAAEPLNGLTSLKEFDSGKKQYNASVQLAVDIGDTVKRIDGTEVALKAPWRDAGKADPSPEVAARDDLMPPEGPDGSQGGRVGDDDVDERLRGESSDKSGEVPGEAPEVEAVAKPPATDAESAGARPGGMSSARDGGPDDLKRIKGVGPKLEELLHGMGFYHFDQIAGWTEEEIAWVDDNLEGFKGRVSRDDWVAQAKALADPDNT